MAFKGLTSVVIPASAPYTNPYWLANTPHTKGLSNVPDQAMVGKPESPAAFSATFNLRVAGQPMQVTVPIRYRWVEPADGEKYRALEVLPPATLGFDRKVYMVPKKQLTEKEIKAEASYFDSIRLPAYVMPNRTMRNGMPVPDNIEGIGGSFSYKTLASNLQKGNKCIINGSFTPGNDWKSGTIKMSFSTDDYDTDTTLGSYELQRLNYPHIPIQTLLQPVRLKINSLNINLGKRNIGYLPGAGDDVAECLKQIGYNITILDDAIISSGNLAKFDAIVIGVRAYNVNERMAGYRSKLLSYIESGGTVIAQYNTNNWVSSLVTQIGPYPFGIGRDRVTNENSPITFLLPDHELMNKPNKITQTDFEGWVQERGIYFAADVAKEYEMPLAMSDANEPPKASNTIFTRYGKGRFIYTGLAFFRQLPAGVPGAYRLFANMIGEAKP